MTIIHKFLVRDLIDALCSLHSSFGRYCDALGLALVGPSNHKVSSLN